MKVEEEECDPYAAHEDEVIKSPVVVVHGQVLMGRDVFLEEPTKGVGNEPHHLRHFRRRTVARQKITTQCRPRLWLSSHWLYYS